MPPPARLCTALARMASSAATMSGGPVGCRRATTARTASMMSPAMTTAPTRGEDEPGGRRERVGGVVRGRGEQPEGREEHARRPPPPPGRRRGGRDR